jgi:hypothetical protein
MHVTVYGPFFFMETTITGIVYLDMFQQFRIQQLDEDDQGRIHFQQDGAPPHYLEEIREYLNTRFPCRWIGRVAPIAWPPRSPNLTHGDSLKIECSYHLYLQMSLSSELELLPQLQK